MDLLAVPAGTLRVGSRGNDAAMQPRETLENKRKISRRPSTEVAPEAEG